MSTELKDLGVEFGNPKRPTVVTFGDNGPITTGTDSLRTAYAHALPTTLGFLAGGMHLLRRPRIVAALTLALQGSNKTLFGHLLKVLGSQLSAVYGDLATVNQLKSYLNGMHLRTIPASQLPPWYVEMFGDQPFSPADEVRGTFYTVSAGIAKGHELVGLIPQSDGGHAYCEALLGTAGYANDIYDGASQLDIGGLYRMAQGVDETPSMDASQLQRAGVQPDILLSILEAAVPGTSWTGASLSGLFIGLMDPADREAFGLSWTNNDADRLKRWVDIYHSPPQDDYFTVSRRGTTA